MLSFLKNIVFLSLKFDFVIHTVQTLMVFTVCQSTRLGVSGLEIVKVQYCALFCRLYREVL